MADIFNRTLYAETNGRGLHRTMDETLESNAVYAIHAVTWEGDYDECKQMFDQYYCNEPCDNDDFVATEPSKYSFVKVLVSKSLRHKVAGRGTVTFTIKCYQKGFEGNVDFERVERDIHCWRALCSSNVPIISQVRLWEKMLDIDRADLWDTFKYIDENGTETEITDQPTKKLCEMIRRGVESYPEYYPVLNVTITFARHPCALGLKFKTGELLGKVVGYNDILPDGYVLPIGENSAGDSPLRDFEILDGEYVLCTADKLQCNGDGSYTLNRSFMKCRQIEKELYLGTNGEYGPY